MASKTKKIFLSCCLLLFFGMAKAQWTTYPMVYAGYEYQNQSFGEAGFRLLMLKSDDVLYRVGASALVGSVHSDFKAMPKLQADILLNSQKGVTLRHGWYFLLGAETTTKFIAPKAGISILGLMDLTSGYAFAYGNELLNGKKLQGFNFNFSLNIPLVVFDGK